MIYILNSCLIFFLFKTTGFIGMEGVVVTKYLLWLATWKFSLWNQTLLFAPAAVLLHVYDPPVNLHVYGVCKVQDEMSVRRQSLGSSASFHSDVLRPFRPSARATRSLAIRLFGRVT
jgi:hypothetical protein